MPRRRKKPFEPPTHSYHRRTHGHRAETIAVATRLLTDGVSTVNEVIAKTGVSRSTVYEWRRNLLEYGSPVAPSTGKKLGRPFALTAADEDALFLELLHRGWMYQDEMAFFLHEERGIKVVQQTISNIIARRGWSWKKVHRESVTKSDELRDLWKQEMSQYSDDTLIFIDESIFNEKTGWRSRGYAPIGHEARYSDSVKRGKTWSILAAIGLDGYCGMPGIKEGYWNREQLIAWLAECLLPYLEDNYPDKQFIIIMDNCATHINAAVRTLIEGAGHQLRYLPPYSPDFNPIEMTFHVLKAWIRRHYFRVRGRWEGRNGFGEFLKYAIETSQCDRFAVEQFRHAAGGVYSCNPQRLNNVRQAVRRYELGQGSDDLNDLFILGDGNEDEWQDDTWNGMYFDDAE